MEYIRVKAHLFLILFNIHSKIFSYSDILSNYITLPQFDFL